MVRASSSRRAILWLAAALMLLKGLLPAVAAGAAAARDLPIHEVCTQFGVRPLSPALVAALAGAKEEPGSGIRQDGGDCALAGIAFGPVADPPEVRIASTAGEQAATLPPGGGFVPDPVRRWIAGLKLDPPRRG